MPSRMLTVGWLVACTALLPPDVGAQREDARAARAARAESLYREVRTLKDRVEIAGARGLDRTPDGAAVADLLAPYATLRARLATLLAAPDTAFAARDRQAVATMKRTLETELVARLSTPDDEGGEVGGGSVPCAYDPEALAAGPTGREALAARMYACYGRAARTIVFDGDTLDRLSILGLLSQTEDSDRRRRLFLALEPVWRSVNGDGGARSPYRRLVGLTAAHWAGTTGGSPVEASLRRLGIAPDMMERWLTAILEQWRAVTPPQPVEPWDFHFATGRAGRVLAPRIPRARLAELNAAYFRGLGADPNSLGIRYDLDPRPGKTPVAYTTFGSRLRPEPWVFATYRVGGLDNLSELFHETGHAIHIAAIRTRPALYDWPDSDPFTEALGDLVSLDLYEPAWQQRYLGDSVPLADALRAKYAGIVLDVAWSLFEIRLHRNPALDPNQVWTALTQEYLRIVPHPELSWWAMRGQLINAPGYMMNYAIGAIIVADLRARSPERNRAWYGWVSERLYRFGLERPSHEVITAFLGRLLSPRALLDDLARIDTIRARLARLDGVMVVTGLDSVVEVRRDRWGVPHIYAKTQHDLFFAQGYVAAQDRLWQMEMWRRAGEGRLAEVLGPALVARDRFARLLVYRGDLAAEWASYAPDTRDIVRAFVDGVNAQIAEVRDRPPIEFTRLGIAPEPWGYQVPLQRMAALAMTGNAMSEVARARLVHLIGVERTERLWPTDPARPLDPAPGLDLDGIDESSLGAAAAAYGAIPYQRAEGSNNWVVSGAKTATGKPLLANDPHRAISNPSLRYLTHLVGPGWNVIGAGEPALPGVAGGHNERVGFGFTIVGMDQQDVYVEQVAACAAAVAGRCYFHRGGWRPIQTLVDTIKVKGEAPRVVRLEFTVHGPIVAEDSVRGRAFALRFVGTEPGTAGYLAQLSIDRATDWPSFLRAAARWKLPTENLVYADVDGNIGWIAAGLNPVRAWSGLLPVPGDGGFEWQGFLASSELPQRFNPPGGVIVTANHNILPPGYTKPLNYEWAPPYRADRIRGVLEAGAAFTVRDFQRLQHDEYSIPAARLVPALVAAAGRRGLSGRPEVRTLAAWDYVMAQHAQAPLLYAAWLRALPARVFRPRAGQGWAVLDSEWDLPTLVHLVTQPDGEVGDSVLLGALDDAVADLTRRLGPDRGGWTWGALHRAAFRHPLAAAYDLPTVPRGGDGNTVNATGGGNYRQTSGASFREVLDLADWDNSVATSAPGQSGQPGSPHYGDLVPLWANGEYFPLVYSRARVEQETAHRLVLTPPPATP